MTKKQKEILFAMPLLNNHEIKVWTVGQRRKEQGFAAKAEPWAVGVVTGFTGTYLLMKNVLIWNGRFFDERMLHTNHIGKILINKDYDLHAKKSHRLRQRPVRSKRKMAS